MATFSDRASSRRAGRWCPWSTSASPRSANHPRRDRLAGRAAGHRRRALPGRCRRSRGHSGAPARPTYAQWRAIDIDRPTRDPAFFFIALAGGEPVGYATIDNFGADAYHGLTAVARSWRRRGVATALKQAQIAAAKKAGFRRLVTASEERNAPMRNLNEKLGYRPEPSLSTVVLRGTTDVRLPHGDD